RRPSRRRSASTSWARWPSPARAWTSSPRRCRGRGAPGCASTTPSRSSGRSRRSSRCSPRPGSAAAPWRSSSSPTPPSTAGRRRTGLRVVYPEPLGRAVAALEPLLPETGIGRRALALLLLADASLDRWAAAHLDEAQRAAVAAGRASLAALGEPPRTVLGRTRL